jgi:hypothetical protein
LFSLAAAAPIRAVRIRAAVCLNLKKNSREGGTKRKKKNKVPVDSNEEGFAGRRTISVLALIMFYESLPETRHACMLEMKFVLSQGEFYD